ncbi:hypothetical protein BDL97_09G035400 [Sphagnum fallax]|nr:hypothetical protein BDL97_09G035400 [Sphagnum fallax]
MDSPGDGDDEEGSKTVGKSKKRRQRRSKSLKAAVSSASPGRSRSPLGIFKCITTTSGCSVSSQASSSSTEAEKDFGVSIAERLSAAEARQGLDSPSDHVLIVEMQADKGGIQGLGLSPEIPLGSLEEENPAAAAASKSLLVWPLQATQFEPSITTNEGIRELVFAQRSPRAFAELRQRSVADNHYDDCPAEKWHRRRRRGQGKLDQTRIFQGGSRSKLPRACSCSRTSWAHSSTASSTAISKLWNSTLD